MGAAVITHLKMYMRRFYVLTHTDMPEHTRIPLLQLKRMQIGWTEGNPFKCVKKGKNQTLPWFTLLMCGDLLLVCFMSL